MAKDHGSSVKNDKQYEGLRKKGMTRHGEQCPCGGDLVRWAVVKPNGRYQLP
jgi:hypothetical protein